MSTGEWEQWQGVEGTERECTNRESWKLFCHSHNQVPVRGQGTGDIDRDRRCPHLAGSHTHETGVLLAYHCVCCHHLEFLKPVTRKDTDDCLERFIKRVQQIKVLLTLLSVKGVK